MAPQNSTLIHENAELATDLSHYSPISKDETADNSHIRTQHNMVNRCDVDVDVNILDVDDGNDGAHEQKSISSSEDINILQVRK